MIGLANPELTEGRQMEIETIPTPLGDGRLFISAATDPRGALVLGHGAGGGVDAPDLVALADRLPALGMTVIRFEQPWRTAGKKVAVLPPKLDIGWRAAIESLAGHETELENGSLGSRLLESGLLGSRLFFGGRSAGARVACRTAPEFLAEAVSPSAASPSAVPPGSTPPSSTPPSAIPPVGGVVCLSFPLHPPGRPEKSRAPELMGAGVPRLVLQGEKDAFGGPDEIRAAIPSETPKADIDLVPVPNADHGLKVAKSSAFTSRDVLDLVVEKVAAFCLGPQRWE